MIYLETYFDSCHGLIPQLVLSAMAIQAGNIRASVYKNALTVDLSSSNTFSFDGFFLTLQGILPLTESRYLISVPSLISRIGAMNSENLLAITDTLGLPVAGFDARLNLEPVQLPLAIDNLSSGVLILEKRLAYLLLLQAKRNNLNTLYNYLYYTRLAGELERFKNIRSAVMGTIGLIPFIAGWDHQYFQIHPLGRSGNITDICIKNLFATYPSLERLMAGTLKEFEPVCDWLQVEMGNDNPVTLPNLDFNLLVSNVAERIAELRYQEPPRDPLGVELIENQGDVSSEIATIIGDTSGSVSLPVNPYSAPVDDSPLIDRPSADYSSLTDSSPTTDSLPPC